MINNGTRETVVAESDLANAIESREGITPLTRIPSLTITSNCRTTDNLEVVNVLMVRVKLRS
jgi:hypothetical protein